MNTTTLDSAILATVIYYDILGQGLTALELRKYLINTRRFGDEDLTGASLMMIIDRLSQSALLRSRLAEQNGYYFLNHRRGFFDKRMHDRKVANEKWNRLKRHARRLAMIPYVRGVFVSGSVAMGMPSADSDLDVLIVTKHGRIWTTRLLVTLMTHLWGVRRVGNNTNNKICLNHFITDESLRIPYESLYNAQTYAHLVPVVDKQGGMLRSRFVNANSWIYEYCGTRMFDSSLSDLRTIQGAGFRNAIARILELPLNTRLGSRLERWVKIYQKRRIDRDPRTHEEGGRVVARDTQLEFHPQSKERDVLARYNNALARFGLAQYARETDSGLTK